MRSQYNVGNQYSKAVAGFGFSNTLILPIGSTPITNTHKILVLPVCASSL